MKTFQRAIAFLLVFAALLCVTFPAVAATVGERNALRTAQNYLSFMGFSYTGLIDQLKYEGYSAAEAKYAADNCGADWYKNALRSAENYMSFMGFSHSGLIDQLKYEGYTAQEAKYAADVCFELATPRGTTITPTPTPTKVAVRTIAAATPKSQVAATPASDLKGYSFAELLALQEAVTQALWASDDWQQVEVPAGVYLVGQDIPAGRWNVQECGKNAYLRIYRSFENGDLTGMLHYSDLDSPANFIFSEGTYVEISHNPILFTPYVSGFGFKFN